MWSGELPLELGDVVGISIQYYLPLVGSGELVWSWNFKSQWVILICGDRLDLFGLINRT